MVRTRKGIYVGNQEIQRRYIGNKLIFENLVDMEDKDKVSGVVIFTDKADDSVVHVDVDGKSYRDGVPTPDYPIAIDSLNDFDVVSSVEKLTEGQLEGYDYDTVYENIYKINLSLSEPLRSVGDAKDRLFRGSDELWKVERNVGEFVLHGNHLSGKNFPLRPDDYLFMISKGNIPNLVSETNNIMLTHAPTVGSPPIGKVIGIHTNTEYAVLYINLGEGVLPSNTSPSMRNWLDENAPILVYELEYPVIEILGQELQDRLNNLRSFQDSNYVYSVLPTVAENLKPMLHATFKSKGWYDHYLKTL